MWAANPARLRGWRTLRWGYFDEYGRAGPCLPVVSMRDRQTEAWQN